MSESSKAAQVRLNRVSPGYWRVILDNPPLNLMGPEFVLQFRDIVAQIESDPQLRVVVFESAVPGFFLNHSDFDMKMEDLTGIPQGPSGLEAWPDILVRLPRAPVVTIAKIRGRATGNGSELTLACDMSFASREKTRLSQWEVAVGMVAGTRDADTLSEVLWAALHGMVTLDRGGRLRPEELVVAGDVRVGLLRNRDDGDRGPEV